MLLFMVRQTVTYVVLEMRNTGNYFVPKSNHIDYQGALTSVLCQDGCNGSADWAHHVNFLETDIKGPWRCHLSWLCKLLELKRSFYIHMQRCRKDFTKS